MDDAVIAYILSPTDLSGGKIELTDYGESLYDSGAIAAGSLLLVKKRIDENKEEPSHVILTTDVKESNIIFEERSVYQAIRKTRKNVRVEGVDLRQVLMAFNVVGEISIDKDGTMRLERPSRPPSPGSPVYQLDASHWDTLFGGYVKRLLKKRLGERASYERYKEALSFGRITGSRNLRGMALWPFINMHLGIVGTTGSGKSFTASSIIERIAKIREIEQEYGIKRSMIVFDVHGEYTETYGESSIEFDGKERERYRENVLVLRPRIESEKYYDSIEAKYFGIDFLLVKEEDYTDEESEDLLYTASEFTEIMKLLYGTSSGTYRSLIERAFDNMVLKDNSVYSLARELHKMAEDLYRGKKSFDEAKKDLIDSLINALKNAENVSIARNTENALIRAFNIFLSRIGRLLVPSNIKGIDEEGIIGVWEIVRLLREGALIIVDLTESGKMMLDNTIKDILISYLLRVIYKTLSGEFYGKKDRLVILIDEAQTFIPARDYDTGAVLTKRIARAIASQGRKFGMSLVLISQRPSFMDQNVFSLMNSLIIHRTAMGDAERIVRTFGLNRSLVNVFSNLKTGDAFLYGIMFSVPTKVHIEKGTDRKMFSEKFS